MPARYCDRHGSLSHLQAPHPVLERNLNSLGIFHFHQLARMTSKDVHWIAGRIIAFPGLSKRYRWVEQARGMAGRQGGRNGGNGRNGDSARP